MPWTAASISVTPQRTSTNALFDYICAGRSKHCAFYHWRPHLSSDCCIGLEQFAKDGPVVSVIASFPRQTENRTFCLVLQSWLTTSHCTDYYYETSLFRLIVTCTCSLSLKLIRPSSSSSSSSSFFASGIQKLVDIWDRTNAWTNLDDKLKMKCLC